MPEDNTVRPISLPQQPSDEPAQPHQQDSSSPTNQAQPTSEQPMFQGERPMPTDVSYAMNVKSNNDAEVGNMETRAVQPTWETKTIKSEEPKGS